MTLFIGQQMKCMLRHFRHPSFNQNETITFRFILFSTICKAEMRNQTTSSDFTKFSIRGHTHTHTQAYTQLLYISNYYDRITLNNKLANCQSQSNLITACADACACVHATELTWLVFEINQLAREKKNVCVFCVETYAHFVRSCDQLDLMFVYFCKRSVFK